MEADCAFACRTDSQMCSLILQTPRFPHFHLCLTLEILELRNSRRYYHHFTLKMTQTGIIEPSGGNSGVCNVRPTSESTICTLDILVQFDRSNYDTSENTFAAIFIYISQLFEKIKNIEFPCLLKSIFLQIFFCKDTRSSLQKVLSFRYQKTKPNGQKNSEL